MHRARPAAMTSARPVPGGRRRLAWRLLAVSWLVRALYPSPAHALAEGDWLLAGGVGPALVDDDRDVSGALSLGAEAQHGLTDAWAVRVGLHHERRLGATRQTRSSHGGLEVGLVLGLDVLRLVPSAELAIGAGWVRSGSDTAGQITLAPGLALDYLVDRRISIGLALRARQGLVRLGGTDAVPLVQTLSLLARVGATY